MANKYSGTQTEMIKISENISGNNGENKLGKYSSEVVKPSNKSTVSSTINFFGKNYTFGADGIPLVGCTISGGMKTCTASLNTSLNNYWYDWYAKTYIAMYEYRLDGNFYKWVKLPSGESISTEPVGDYKKYNRFRFKYKTS